VALFDMTLVKTWWSRWDVDWLCMTLVLCVWPWVAHSSILLLLVLC